MSRGQYSPAKRQREADKARKKQDKLERRREKRDRGPGEVEVVSAHELMDGLPTSDEVLRRMEEQANSPRQASAIPARLFVGGLSDRTTANDLRKLFEEHGPVIDAVVVTDRETGSSRGFGFVTMESRKDAPKAIENLDGAELHERRIVVNVATERSR
jgi:RNA recognition motif-containing protein